MEKDDDDNHNADDDRYVSEGCWCWWRYSKSVYNNDVMIMMITKLLYVGGVGADDDDHDDNNADYDDINDDNHDNSVAIKTIGQVSTMKLTLIN